MVKLSDLKKGLAPLAKAKTEIDKQVRIEIDLEKAATALLLEPVEGIEKADEADDADELAKSLIERIDAIESLLAKGESDEDGRLFVTVDTTDALAKEFAVDVKSRDKDKSKKTSDDDDADEGTEDDVTKADDDGEVSWEADLAGKAARRRHLTKGEQVVSTDPSARADLRKARAERQKKRDRVLKGQRCMSAGD